MQINIDNNKIKKVFNDPKELIKTVGLDKSKIIKRRLNEISSANNFYDYLHYAPGKPHPLSCNMDGLYGVHISDNYRLVLEPLSSEYDDKSLKLCEKVNLKGVCDYHGGKLNWIIP